MAPGGEMYRLYEHFGENVLCHGSHEWLPYSKNAMRTKSPNTPIYRTIAVFYILLLITPIRISPATTRSSAAKPAAKLSE